MISYFYSENCFHIYGILGCLYWEDKGNKTMFYRIQGLDFNQLFFFKQKVFIFLSWSREEEDKPSILLHPQKGTMLNSTKSLM